MSLTGYFGQLNPVEAELYSENRGVGTIALARALVASDLAERHYETWALHNGNGDAFRHAVWNFLMTTHCMVGPYWAQRWGDAHEDGDPANLENPMEAAMDKWNNAVGRNFALANPYSGAETVIDAVRSGQCRILQGGLLLPSYQWGELPPPKESLWDSLGDFLFW